MMRAHSLLFRALFRGGLIGACALAAVAGAGDVSAEQLVISTGRQAGSYYYIGKRLESAVLLQPRPPRIRVETSVGSLENLALLNDASSDVNVALTQKDALRYYLNHFPDFASKFIILGEVGQECALVIARTGGPIASAADLKKEQGLQLAVGDYYGGAAVTWMNLTLQDRAFGNTAPLDVSPMEGMLQLEVGGEFTKIGAVLLVQRPRRESGPVKLLLESPDLYSLVPLTAADVASPKLPNGDAVYSFETVKVGGSNRLAKPLEVETVCTQGLLVAAIKKLSAEHRELLSTLMIEKGDEIKGTQ